MSVASENPARAISAVSVAVVGASGAYDMFDVIACDASGVKVRGPVLLEVSEEVPLRVSRNGASVDVRARVTKHEKGDGGAVTELVLVDGETELRRLLGA
jgi:hypothetical protein